MPPCCPHLLAAIMAILLWGAHQQFTTIESAPTIERRAPVVNDAITSNETLAAARNAFLIGHLFEEFDDEEKRKKANREKQEGPKPTAKSEKEHAGLVGELAGEGEEEEDGQERISGDEREEEGREEPMQPQQGDDINHPAMVPQTTTPTTTTTISTTTDGNKAETNLGDEERRVEAIKPVNVPINPAQRHLGEEKEAAKDVPLSRPTAVQEESNQSGTSQKPAEEEDATNPFIYPPTQGSEQEGEQPGWLRALFFTAICTGIGFFLLMLLIGLIGRFEGGGGALAEREEPQPRRSVRPAGDARVVPIIEEGPVMVARPSAY